MCVMLWIVLDTLYIHWDENGHEIGRQSSDFDNTLSTYAEFCPESDFLR